MSHSPALFAIFFGGWVRNSGFMFTEFVTWGGGAGFLLWEDQVYSLEISPTYFSLCKSTL